MVLGIELDKKWRIRHQFLLASGHQMCCIPFGLNFLSHMPLWLASRHSSEALLRYTGIWPALGGEQVWVNPRVPIIRRVGAWAYPFLHSSPDWDGAKKSHGPSGSSRGKARCPPLNALGLEVLVNCSLALSWAMILVLLVKTTLDGTMHFGPCSWLIRVPPKPLRS